VGLKDTIVRALALRWAQSKVKDLRGKDSLTVPGKILKFLDGWKLVIGVLVLLAVHIYDASTGSHSANLTTSILNVIGWAPGSDWLQAIGQATGAVMILVGLISKFVKAVQQARAGSSLAGLLTTEGYISKYVADVTSAEAAKSAAVNSPPKA
jgi:hypothetical protein